MLGGFPGHQSEINTGIIQHTLAALNSLFHLNAGSLSLPTAVSTRSRHTLSICRKSTLNKQTSRALLSQKRS